MLGQNYVIAPGVQGTVTLATPQAGEPGRRRCQPAGDGAGLEQRAHGLQRRPLQHRRRRPGARRHGRAAHRLARDRARLRSARGAAALHLRQRDGEGAQALRARQRDRQRRQRAQRDHASPARAPSWRTTCARSRSSTSTGCRACRSACSRCSPGKASKVVADLEKVFGEQSKSPVAGMFRFMPLEGANAVLVITRRPSYLDEIQEWLERIDGAGGERAAVSRTS